MKVGKVRISVDATKPRRSDFLLRQYVVKTNELAGNTIQVLQI